MVTMVDLPNQMNKSMIMELYNRSSANDTSDHSRTINRMQTVPVQMSERIVFQIAKNM